MRGFGHESPEFSLTDKSCHNESSVDFSIISLIMDERLLSIVNCFSQEGTFRAQNDITSA